MWIIHACLQGWFGFTYGRIDGAWTVFRLLVSCSYKLLCMQALKMSDNGLTGTLSSKVSSLSRLISLDLSQNQLSGPVPTELASLTGLTQLLLQENQFSVSGAAGALIAHL